MDSFSDLYQRDLNAVAGIEKLRFFPLAVESGKGAWLTEVGGRKLLDCTATWTACGLGHGHPRITEAVIKAMQSPAGAGGSAAVHPDSVAFAEELMALVPGSGDRRVYIGHAGTDANDVVLRACRKNLGRQRVIAFKHGYHGGMGTALQVSGVHIEAGVKADDDLYLATYPNPFRPHVDGADPVQASMDASLAEVSAQLELGDVACLMVEPILSDGGLVVPPKGFLAELSKRCKAHDVPFVVDEVKVGLGRPGILHAFQYDDVVPDIVTFGKTIGGGLPLSAAVGPKDILDGPPAAALLTTAGNPICTAAGRETLRVLIEEDLPGRADRAGRRLRAALAAAMSDMPQIGDVRGRGLAIGLELVKTDGSNERDGKLAQMTVYRAWELGLVVYYVGGNVLEITPPMIISDEEVDLAAEIILQAIKDASAGMVPYEKVRAYAGW
ncbi:aminotransferase class III-fold pyridoxal phosphate-dependent enzyme [uncultured Pseudodesulfovibrio sp.]|uniref:aspartate aminotransferase family protein n=1 Tax=uncultured Pseudodesulfovibrio sp. TaxID=2035858 RepID=UPI0029C8E350|nr:aminotransferase class III-fold pyridoxal phosphate-dependent enzyme [uncultured Pseudodesulfovibrio sp.]